MDPSTAIKQFLDRVRRRRKGFLLVQGGLQVLAWGLAGMLIGNLIAYFSDNPRPFLGPFLIIWAAFLGIGLAALLVRALFFKTPLQQTALWVENRVGNLNNALISSIQL